MINDKSCFKGRPFLTEKGAAKGKKITIISILQLQQSLSVKFCKTQPYVCIFWHCLGQEFLSDCVCTTESIYRHLSVGEDTAQNQDPLPLSVVYYLQKSTSQCRISLSFQVKNTCVTILGFGTVSFKWGFFFMFIIFCMHLCSVKSFKSNYSTVDKSLLFKVIRPRSLLFIWVLFFMYDNVFTDFT